MAALLLTYAVAILLAGGLVCLLAGRNGALANRVGVVVSIIGGAAAMAGGAMAMWTGQADSFHAPWSIPFGSFYVAVDSLSAFFVLAICAVCMLSAVYGGGYMKAYLGRKNLGVPWFFYNVLFASMLMVVIARNGVLFLMAWEVMSLASFFLVVFEHERQETLEAGWTYLVATHLGTAFLLALFVLLGWGQPTWDFDQFNVPAGQMAGIAFLLALVGFGTKAGLVPMHVWLPEAHPAAPSHVSAVMSGVMIKTGIYGLLRSISFLGPAQDWWGWTLIGVGAASGLLGILMALSQRDLKRLLAYSSVENIGIICLGIGLGLLGTSQGMAALAFAGFAGAMLHVWNHAAFKSLLFLGAGAVAHATGTRNIEQLGGLLKKMPSTGLAFFVGAAAISALPPLNGFVGELVIYIGAFGAIAGATTISPGLLAGLAAIACLALIGGLAAACFAKAFSVTFLGEPRSVQASSAHESPRSMRGPMLVLAGICVTGGLAGSGVLRLVAPVIGVIAPAHAAHSGAMLDFHSGILWKVGLVGAALIAVAAGVAILRRKLLAGRQVETTGTWDCGYAAPTSRMQYTGSSFAWPILNMFRWFLRPIIHRQAPEGLFPKTASLQTQSPDLLGRFIYRPVFLGADWVSGHLRWVQQGRNQLYILYIALALIILLAWKLGADQ